MTAFTIELIPTNEYGAREVAASTETWLHGCVGICEPTAEAAVDLAESKINDHHDHKDEIGRFYTIKAIEV